MKIALIGVTGAGKSTVAEELHKRFQYHVVSTGDFVRKNFPTDPLEGGFSDREKQILEHVDQSLGKNRVVLDGFPRHMKQAQWLCRRIPPNDLLVVFMRLPRNLAWDRVQRRGRADLAHFEHQHKGQVLALDDIEVYLMNNGYLNLVVGPFWTTDEIVRRIRDIGRLREARQC